MILQARLAWRAFSEIAERESFELRAEVQEDFEGQKP
jgi:hypothetical protein